MKNENIKNDLNDEYEKYLKSMGIEPLPDHLESSVEKLGETHE